MQCVTPMFRRYMLGNHKDGKIVPRQEVYKELQAEPNKIRWYLDTFNRKSHKWQYEMIPCNHCWACNLNYSAQWATRIMYECSQYEHNYFITFTYDDIHLPIPERASYGKTVYINDGTWSGSLFPDDITRFINSLRKYFERKGHTGIKYFYAGEYGETTKRPHYHMILMNCPLDINQFHDFHVDERKKLHWKSYEIENYWKEGMIDIGEVEFASAAYCARYCMKKLTNETDKSVYYRQGKIPEFVRMSRNPGIGTQYYEEHKDEIYKTDSVIAKNFHGDLITVKPPKAWDKKFKESHPDQWREIEKSRKACSERSRKLLETMTDVSDFNKLLQNTQDILRKGSQLPRVGEW